MRSTSIWVTAFASLALPAFVAPSASHAQEKPNILVIMADDIGWMNPSFVHRGMLGYSTPNIDQIAKDGVWFTDAYGQQSCTAGRSAFITGQSPKRTGLIKIGMPGDPIGISEKDPTIAEMLKPMGYMTGQFGKNHVGDRDEHLPTNHGFDEFFGNLYHLNSEEEPEEPDYPKDPEFRKKYGPRGVLKSTAGGEIIDTGPLTKKRMETVDEEFLSATLDFIDRAADEKKPFFVWFNPSRMHIFTHLKESSQGVTGKGLYADGMVEHDGHVGQLLNKLKERGLTDNTIVIYTSDNGAQKFSWPDAGVSPFRGEKASTWEGGVRVPLLVSWPKKIKKGWVSNEIISLEDLFPTLMAAAGDDKIKQKLLEGTQAGDKTFKVHLDGYNFLPYISGDAKTGPRETFYYFVDDGTLGAMRYLDYKANFSVQKSDGFGSWLNSQTPERAPILANLRSDPFEEAPRSGAFYEDYLIRHMWVFGVMKRQIAGYAQSYKAFPPRQVGGSFVPKQ